MSLRKLPSASVRLLVAVAVALAAATASATFNYEYGADEYVTINDGASPDGRLAITTHGGGEYGYDHFHVYLFDAATGKKIGPLEEIAGVLDTGAGAYCAKWSKDSTGATIIYRVDRHAPLKAMTYRFAKGRAVPATRQPVDVSDDTLAGFYSEHCSDPRPPGRKFGSPQSHQ